MPRPRKCRFVEKHPDVTYFKPQGIPMRNLVEISLTIDGYEAVRLVDYQGMSIEEAAEAMGVSRHILSRVLAEARKALAETLVKGRALRIEGGTYRIRDKNHSIQQGTAREDAVMMIAVTSEGPGLEHMIDPRFGRAAGFVIVNTETMDTEYLDNGASQALAQGAGIQTAQAIADKGISVVLTGYVGPKAFQALQVAGVRVGQDLENMTVGEAVKRFMDGKVTLADEPDK